MTTPPSQQLAQVIGFAEKSKEQNLTSEVVESEKEGNREQLAIILILLYPFYAYYVQKKTSVMLCNKFDNNLITYIDNARASSKGQTFPFTGAQVAMSLRSSMPGLFNMLDFPPEFSLLPAALQWINEDEGGGQVTGLTFTPPAVAGVTQPSVYNRTLQEMFQDSQSGGNILYYLHNNIGGCAPQGASSGCTVHGLVCHALSPLFPSMAVAGGVSKCKKATKSGGNCWAQAGIAAAQGCAMGAPTFAFGPQVGLIAMAIGGVAGFVSKAITC